MISQGSGNKTDQPIFSTALGQRLPAHAAPGRAVPLRRRPGALPVEPARHRSARPAGAMLDGVGRAQPHGRAGVRRSRDQHAHRPVRDGVPDADVGPRADRPVATSRKHILDLYGIDDTGTDGGFARNCLLARRMAERGVRFVQLMHRGWDQHSNLPTQIRGQCRDVDQPAAALVKDLKQRGLLDDTLVIWGGEFGRTVYSQGTLTPDELRPRPPWPLLHDVDGRRRHQAGHQLTARPTTICYNIVKDPVHIHDLQRHHPPLPGHRPHPADLPLPGPRLPADRRPRKSGPRIACLGARRRPLTLTLSPKTGRGRTGSPLPVFGERARVRGR